MTHATYEIGTEPRQDVGKLTKDRNAEPLAMEFVCGDTTRRIRDGIEAQKAAANERDALRGAA